MKNIILSLSAISLVSCGVIPTKELRGVGEKEVMRTVSVEKNCPIENVKIVSKTETTSNGTYRVEACGNTYVYKEIGSVLMEDKQVENILGK